MAEGVLTNPLLGGQTEPETPMVPTPIDTNSVTPSNVSNPFDNAASPPGPVTAPLARPGVPPPPQGSFAQKLLTAIGGVLSGVSKTGTETLAASGNQAAAANLARQDRLKQQKIEQDRQQRQLEDTEAQQKRIQQREDDEAHARTAMSNAQLHNIQTTQYHLGNEYMDKNIAQGKADLASMAGPQEAGGLVQPYQSGVDEGQMNALMQQGKLNSYEYTAFPTGKKIVGETDDKQPIYQTTYDIVKVPNSWTPTDAQIERIKKVPGYENFQKGTKVSGPQLLSALRFADTQEATADSVNDARAKAGLQKMTNEQVGELAQFNKSGDWLKYLNTYATKDGADLLKSAQHMISDPAMAQKYPNLYHDVMAQFADQGDPTGVKNYNNMRKEYLDNAEKLFKDQQNGLGQIPGGGALTDEMKANIAALPKDKQAVVDKYDAPTKASLYSFAFGPGDLSLDSFPSRVSAKSGQLDKEHAVGVIRQLNPNWNEGQYKLIQNAYKNVTFGRNGQDVETYNNLLDHMAAAQDVIEDSLRANNPKFLNSAINVAEKEGWGTEATKIQTALEPVKDEFSSLMNNGHALHADQAKLYDAMVNPASTPAQLEAAFKNFGATGVVRLLGLNDQYKKIAGKNLPGIVRKEALESAKHLSLDSETMKKLNSMNSGDTLFHNPNWNPGTAAEQQQAVATQDQQKQAALDAAKAIAAEAAKAGKLPAGTVGTAVGADGNLYYVDAQHKPLARVQ